MPGKDPYRRVASWYDGFFGKLNRSFREMGLALVPPGPEMRILDVGCGTGEHLHLCRKEGSSVFGIDMSPAMLRVAHKKLGEDGHVCLGDGSRMPYADESFDLVTSTLALHEMNPEMRSGVVREMKRVLKPEGKALLIDFHPGPVRGIGGRFNACVVFLVEFAAGWEHFRNFRDFVRRNGLTALVEDNGLVVDKQRVVGGGNFALCVARIPS